MTLLLYLLIGFIALIIGILLFFKLKWTVYQWNQDRKKRRLNAVQPSILFSVESKSICLENTGKGPALDIQIKDFHHPDETAWYFKFSSVDSLAPGRSVFVDFDFFVDDLKAANKTDLLWMFDPDHDHEFTARIEIEFQDSENRAYIQTHQIGNGTFSSGSPVLKTG